LEQLDEILLNELSAISRRFECRRYKTCWFISSKSMDTTLTAIYHEKENEISIYNLGAEILKARNRKEIESFLKEITKEEDTILVKKGEILKWVRKTHKRAAFEGNTLNLKPGIKSFYLGKEPFLKGKYYSYYEEEHFVSDDLEEVFQWAFEKVKKPIQLARVKNIFKK